MSTLISPAKYRGDTVSLFFSFSGEISQDRLPVSSVTVVSEVFTGIDPFPQDILYLGYIVTGTTVEQRVTKGTPGVIYLLTVRVVDALGEEYEKETYIAVLPEDIEAPNYIPQELLSSSLYPYLYGDSLTSSAHLLSGRDPYFVDNVTSRAALVSGALHGGSVLYTVGTDKITIASSLISGTLAGGAVQYTVQTDSVTASCALIYGYSYSGGVTYTTPKDSVQVTSALVSGSIS